MNGRSPSKQAGPDGWATLARLIRPQGRHGEILADLLTDFPETLPGRAELYLLSKGDLDPVSVEITRCWLPTGKQRGRAVLTLRGTSTIEQAEAMAGSELVTPITRRAPLEAGGVYVTDLVGSRLLDRDVEVGTITEVRFPASPDGKRRLEEAAPILAVLSLTGEEHLVPFVQLWTVSFDAAKKELAMELPAGLLELNAPVPLPQVGVQKRKAKPSDTIG